MTQTHTYTYLGREFHEAMHIGVKSKCWLKPYKFSWIMSFKRLRGKGNWGARVEEDYEMPSMSNQRIGLYKQ